MQTKIEDMLQPRYLETYLEERQANGKYTFTSEDVLNDLPVSKSVLHQSLRRIRKVNKVALIRKGFYVIVPPEHRSRGVLPLSWFLDDLMKFIDRPYYLGLLNAAALYEAGHQQPQEYYVVTTGDGLRNVELENLKINFLFRKDWPEKGIQQRKVPTGYLKISSPELTAIDLIKYESRIGGLSRVATVLDELAEKLDGKLLCKLAELYTDLPTIQRLGYLLEEVLGAEEIAAPLIAYLETQNPRKIPLKPSKNLSKTLEAIHPWKVVPNITVESDL